MPFRSQLCFKHHPATLFFHECLLSSVRGGGVFTYKPFCVVLAVKCNRLAGVVCRRMVIPYEGQSFSTLRRQCLQNRRLFEDPLFPAADQSLFYQTNRVGRVTWKRPKVSRNTSSAQSFKTASTE